jgi:hypothetical protein
LCCLCSLQYAFFCQYFFPAHLNNYIACFSFDLHLSFRWSFLSSFLSLDKKLMEVNLEI